MTFSSETEVQSLLRHRPTLEATSSLQELGHFSKSLYSEAIEGPSHLDLIYPLWLTVVKRIFLSNFLKRFTMCTKLSKFGKVLFTPNLAVSGLCNTLTVYLLLLDKVE